MSENQVVAEPLPLPSQNVPLWWRTPCLVISLHGDARVYLVINSALCHGGTAYYSLMLGIYVMFVLYSTKVPYRMMIEKSVEDIREYTTTEDYCICSPGVGSFCVPFLFTDFWYPMVCGIILTIFTYIAHVSGRRMYWFQTEQNQNDVKFSLMWWVSCHNLGIGWRCMVSNHSFAIHGIRRWNHRSG